MCGFIFSVYSDRSQKENLVSGLRRMSWRGPDAESHYELNEGSVFLGHRRLAVIDPQHRSDQPMRSRCGRYHIVFNGEIYNHLEIRRDLGLSCETLSDTETILEGYALLGEQIIPKLDGMFAFVIYDRQQNRWICARDGFGIKPLYIYRFNDAAILCSEAAVIAEIVGARPDADSVEEWKIVRRPVPGFSFFKNIREVLPGTIERSDGSSSRFYSLKPSVEVFSQEKFEQLLRESVVAHELSDVSNVGLLSGGLDSGVITALSKVDKCYTVGLDENNEFLGAEETATVVSKNLVKVVITENQLLENWRYLTRLRGEPLSVPNEGLIFQVCKAMQDNEKVMLTGEGADELLFGYDGIFRWAVSSEWCGVDDFLARYGYSLTPRPTQRLLDYIENLREGKSLIEFTEDFFYDFHLPGLLRRMDFASMAASKEARVPFVSKALVEYMYRRPHQIKIDGVESKIPLRRFAKQLGLQEALDRKKIGFSAQMDSSKSRQDDYLYFQEVIMEALEW